MKLQHLLGIVLLFVFSFFLIGGVVMPDRVLAEDSSVDTPVSTPEAGVQPAQVDDAQPVQDEEPAPNQNDRITPLIAIALAFLLYCGSLAAAIQVIINKFVKPPLKYVESRYKMTRQQYLIMFYVVQTLLTGIAYFGLWGGVPMTRLLVPILPAFIPDFGLAIITIAFVVLGEEIIHPAVEWLYAARDAAKYLLNINLPDGTTWNRPTVGDMIDAHYRRQRAGETGQGLVEYALILVLVAVVVIVILALLGPAIGNIFSSLVQTL